MAAIQKVSGLWVGETLPWMPRLCIKSFLDHGIDFELFTYKAYDDIPEGTIVRDGRDILPEACLFTLNSSPSSSYAAFSDWFRYELMLREGSFWVDMDLMCVKNAIPRDPIWFCRERTGTVAPGVMTVPSGHFVAKHLRDLAKDPAEPMPWDSIVDLDRKCKLKKRFATGKERRKHSPFGYAGPSALNKLVKYYGLDYAVAPTHEVYAVSYIDWKKFYNGTLHLDSPEFKDSWGLHLYNGMLSRNPSVASSIKKDSVIGQLLDRHFPGQTIVPTC